MEAYEDDPGTEIVSSLWHARNERKRHELLERAKARFRSSASRLRASGAAHEARRVEQFAEWAHLDRHEPQAARRLHDGLGKSYAIDTSSALVDEVLARGYFGALIGERLDTLLGTA